MTITYGSTSNPLSDTATYFYDGRIYKVRDLVGLGQEVKMDTVNEAVSEITEGVDVKVRLKRTVPGKPFLIEVEAKDNDTINIVRQRAIDKWEV